MKKLTLALLLSLPLLGCATGIVHTSDQFAMAWIVGDASLESCIDEDCTVTIKGGKLSSGGWGFLGGLFDLVVGFLPPIVTGGIGSGN